MRILKRAIGHKDGEGYLVIEAHEQEDMYHLYNLISEGDTLTADTVRNVIKESSTGSVNKQRVHFRIHIEVLRVEFDAEQCSLRVNGRNTEESEYIKMGQHHTVELELNQKFTLHKVCWDAMHLERLNEACDPAKKADLAVLVMQEGLANLCLVTSALTFTKAKIERQMPKKNQLNQGHSKAMQRFFADMYEAIKTHVDFSVIKAVLVGSPGFLREDFMVFLAETAVQRNDIELIKNKSKFVKVHSSSGYKRSIAELLSDASLKSQLGEVKAADEVLALQRFHTMLSTDEDRACYGYVEVLQADAQLAVEELLVTDKLFKSANVRERRMYVNLVEAVKEHGGRVYVFSSMHVSGEQLDMYTGVAATLRFPIPPMETFDDASTDSSDAEGSHAKHDDTYDFVK